MRIFRHYTSHSKTIAIYRLLKEALLFWEGFPQGFGTRLQGFATIQPKEHQ